MPPTIVLIFGCIAVAMLSRTFRDRVDLFFKWIMAPWPIWFGVASALVIVMLFRHTVADHKEAFD